MRRLLLVYLAAGLSAPAIAQVPSDSAPLAVGTALRWLVRGQPDSVPWAYGWFTYQWSSDWGSAVCMRVTQSNEQRDAPIRLSALDSLEVAVDSVTGARLRHPLGVGARLLWRSYPLLALRRADAGCPEP